MGLSFRWLYDRAPVVGQNVMCSVAGQIRNWQRYNSDFDARSRFFRESAFWSLEQAEAYQLQQLQGLLTYCIEKVPHYQSSAYQSLRGSAIRSLQDWRHLPALSKDDVRLAGTQLLSSDYDLRKLIVSHSGGSTGMPLRCYHDKRALQEVYANFWANQRPGVSRSDRYATFQGIQILPQRQQCAPYWRMNYAMNQRLFSIFHLSEKTIRTYIHDLDAFRPVYMAGYANSLYLLAALSEEQNVRPLHSPKAVFTTSEQLLPTYRQRIERVFRTKVWDAYSQDETCGSITQYECEFYHYERAYGYMEFQDLERLPNGHRLAEIICTGFLNRPWPLLRYRPGDIVEYEPVESCPICKRTGPIIYAIRGRTGDVLRLPSGRRFPHISLIVKSLRGVRQVQLVQTAPDCVNIRFVASESFRRDLHVEEMKQAFSEAVGEPISWSVEQLAEIPRTSSGKFMSIVNAMDGSSCQTLPQTATHET